jgi:tetratricopeptide (TPR) repeat protein
MSSRLSRQEIKRDEVLETLGGFFGFVRKHGRTILMGIGATVLAVLAIVSFRVIQHGKAAEGSEALALALTAYGAPIDPAGANPDDPTSPVFASEEARSARATALFADVAADYAGTAPGDIAGAYLGSIASAAGDLAQAREQWENYLDRQGGHILASEVRLNLMSLDREEGKGAELVDSLRAELSSARPDLPEEVLLNQLALTLESLDRHAEARDIYQRLVQDYPTSPYFAIASERIAALEAGAGA